MKNISIFILTFLMVFITSSLAFGMSISYTGDNIVGYIKLDEGDSSYTEIPLGTNSDDWTQSDTYTFTDNSWYEIVFEVQNDGSLADGNPAGFLASFFEAESCFGNTGDGDWLASTSLGGTYGKPLSPPQYSRTSVPALNGDASSHIWQNVAGISSDAAWIWVDETSDTAYFKYENPAPVPEPTTMLLFGTGLLGLVGFGRKKFFSKN